MSKNKFDENSEAYKELLYDFLNFEETGFKPFGKGIGGVDHFRSKGDYFEKTVGSRHSFRSLALGGPNPKFISLSCPAVSVVTCLRSVHNAFGDMSGVIFFKIQL